MIIKIWKIPFCYMRFKGTEYEIPFNIEEKGYIELKEFNEDECWHLCNWSCWDANKPNNLFSDVEVANDDIVFHNPKEDKYYLALTSGWHCENTFEEMVKYIKEADKL